MTSSSSNPLKRPSPISSAPPPKKTFSIFSPSTSPPFTLRPLSSSLSPGSCLYAVSPPSVPPRKSRKVAAFDLDGTLIENVSKNVIARDEGDCKEWTRRGIGKGGVKAKLRELVDDGYAIVIFSNQNLRPAQIETYKRKLAIHLHAKYALAGIPFQIFAALEKDEYRKPCVGMWEVFRMGLDENGRKGEEEEVDWEKSFFVGDAAGRQSDHSDSDRKFAENIGLKFYTPEEFFCAAPKPLDMKNDPSLWDPKSYDHTQPPWSPTNTPLVPPPSGPFREKKEVEVVIFVGSPGVGKTSFYKKDFAPRGYVHINQDTLKTRPACLSLLRQTLSSPTPKSCIVDNTSPTTSVRAEYISLIRAEFPGVRIRAFEWEKETHMRVARQNNVWRALGGGGERRMVLPLIAFLTWESRWEKVSLEEGFDEIKQIRFRFEGSEEERKKWERWSSIYGKR